MRKCSLFENELKLFVETRGVIKIIKKLFFND